MIDALKAYPKYKDSGLAWLGQIPKHWDCLPHRAIFEEVKEQGHIDEQLLSVTIGRGIIRQDDLLAESSKKDSSNLDKSKYKLVQPGDIAYNKMRAWQGAMGVSRYQGIVSPAYIVQRLRRTLRPEYFHYLFRTPGFAKEAERWSYGITSDQWSLRPQHFKMIYSCVPPVEEQQLIVGFLLDFDRQVRSFILNRRRLIEVLNEQKQAIINGAVRRGLDPDVGFEPTGIDWLGEIPEHWEAIRFKLRVGFQEGPGIMAADFRDAGVPLLRISCLASDPATLTGCNYLDPSKVREKWQHFRVQPGDYLLSASASTGSVSRASEEVVGAVPYTGILRLWPLSKNVNMEYIRYFIASQPFAAQIDTAKSGVAIEHFGPTHLKRMWISLPPIEEQSKIVAFLENELRDSDAMVSRASREIELIREYRAKLIADVVTGKVDVRHLGSSPGSEDLEEMIEELEPLDDTAGELDEEALAGGVAHADD